MSFFQRLKTLLPNVRRSQTNKEQDMGDTNKEAPAGTSTTPAAGTPVVDVQKLVADAVAAATQETAKTIGELRSQMEMLTKAGAEAKTPDKKDEISIEDQINRALEQRLAKEQSQKARSDYAAKYLAGVPAVYHSQLPDTNDEKVLAEAGKKIQDQFAADLKALGVSGKEVAGNQKSGEAPGATVDYLKMSDAELRQAAIAKLPQPSSVPSPTPAGAKAGTNTGAAAGNQTSA